MIYFVMMRPVKLVEPNVERDAPLSLSWLQGEAGKRTLQLMGVPEDDIKEPTLEQEQNRLHGFLTNKNQLNWMIEYDGAIVGSVWVDLKINHDVPAPSVHIMLGDPRVRGKGVGIAAISAVLRYLESQGNETVYSRHLVTNDQAQKLLNDLGFKTVGTPYTDQYDHTWQSVIWRQSHQRESQH